MQRKKNNIVATDKNPTKTFVCQQIRASLSNFNFPTNFFSQVTGLDNVINKTLDEVCPAQKNQNPVIKKSNK